MSAFFWKTSTLQWCMYVYMGRDNMAQRSWNVEKSANNSGTFEVQYLESLLLQNSGRSLDVPTSLANGWVYTLQILVIFAQQNVPVKYFKICYILFVFFFIFSIQKYRGVTSLRFSPVPPSLDKWIEWNTINHFPQNHFQNIYGDLFLNLLWWSFSDVDNFLHVSE